MARENGGGGALAWTLLGFLAGVAATLGIQLLLNGPVRAPHGGEAAAPSAAAPVAVAASSAPPAVKKPEVAPAASTRPPRAQPAAEVADDAAAAGMTSRTAPADADPDVPADRPAQPSN